MSYGERVHDVTAIREGYCWDGEFCIWVDGRVIGRDAKRFEGGCYVWILNPLGTVGYGFVVKDETGCE